MIFRLLLGRAGTGRTERCMEEITNHERRDPLGPLLLLITPDQATFTMEQELAARGGSMRARILGFRRFAHQVLQEVGGVGRTPVSELGRRMILKNIIMSEKARLPILGSLHNRPGFLETLSQLITEMKTHYVDPALLSDLRHSIHEDEQLSMKLEEVSLVYRCLEDRLAEQMTDPDGFLDLLIQRLPYADHLNGCRVWVDGFVSFTPQEIEVLRALVTHASEICVTLCLDPLEMAERPPDYSPFIKSWRTRQRLKDLARAVNAKYEEVRLVPDATWRLAAAPDIGHLEKQYFSYPTKVYRGEAQRVHVLTSVNPRAEVDGVVRIIRRLLRSGLRPRQIMVAIRNVDAYFPLFRHALADHDIPFFLDHRQPVAHHPLVELIRSALEVGCTDWAYEPVFRYLKAGFSPVTRDDIDRLENYALAAGIRGNRWYRREPWSYQPGRVWMPEEESETTPSPPNYLWNLDEINSIRWKAIAELHWAWREVKDFSVSSRPHRLKGRDWARVLVDLCLHLKVPHRLDVWSRAALEDGKPEMAQEHRQAWRLVTGVLDELVEVLGETEITSAELTGVLDAAWEGLRLSLIPPRLDAVTIGSLERSHPPRDIRAMFLPGLNEGVLPTLLRTHSVLTESEKECLSQLLAGQGREFPLTSTDRLEQEQFLIYRALTRTSGDLWLSFPLGDNEGSALLPSPVVRRVQEILPGLDIKFLPLEPPGGTTDEEWMEHPADLLPHFSKQWREVLAGQLINPAWLRSYNLLVMEPKWKDRFRQVTAGLWESNQEAPLGPDVALELWGKQDGSLAVIHSSVSRLEKFAGCPFAFFLETGLGLQERIEYGLAPPDTGQLYHEALRMFVTRVHREGLDWCSLDDAHVERHCKDIVDELAERLQDRILLSSARLLRQKEYLQERVSHSARAITRQLQMSRFRPVGVEVAFGIGGIGIGGTRHLKSNEVEGDEARGDTSPSTTPPFPFRPEVILPPLEVDVGSIGHTPVMLRLRGRIDRVDIAQGTDSLYLRVIDYKTGSSGLDLPNVLAGIQLQLPVYWQVAEHGLKSILRGQGHPEKEIRSGGIFHFRIDRPLLSLDPDGCGDIDDEWLKTFRLDGWLVDHGQDSYGLQDETLDKGRSSLVVPLALNNDGSINKSVAKRLFAPEEWDTLQVELEGLLGRMCRDILRGRVDIAPAKSGNKLPCRYCSYRAVCRFDPALPENRPRSVNAGDKVLRDQLAKVAGGEALGLFVYDLDS